MKTAGIVLREARSGQGLELSEISAATRIKEKFLQAIETSDWGKLPNASVAQGFTRSYAQFLKVDPERVLALLRRDFPFAGNSTKKEKEIAIQERRIWTPKATATTTILAGFLVSLVYLLHQYFVFVAPPDLKAQVSIQGEKVEVKGKTNPQATLEVNGQAVLIEREGSFNVEMERSSFGSRLEIKATSRSGKERKIEKQID